LRDGKRFVTANDPRRRLLLELLRAALAAVDGRACTRDALIARLPAAQLDSTRYRVAALGKAAGSMALGAADALGGRLERTLILTKDGHIEAGIESLPGVQIHESAHPVPDARTLASGARLLEFIDELPPGVRPIFLVSGGASSLVEVLIPEANLEMLQALNRAGLASGAAIEALNAERRRISLIKGGQLSARLRGRAALALFISDVPDDDPAVIGSGVLGPMPGQERDDVERVVIASIEAAMRAVRSRAGGLKVSIAPSRFAQDAERLAVRFAHELHLGREALKVWGGESVVRLPPHPGRGGRNQHLALAAARLIAGQDELLLLAVGTDGSDGATDSAGALVDGETCARIALTGLDVDSCLRRADSATALAAAGDLIDTGPTGTNVGDLVIGLRLSWQDAAAWLQKAHEAH
jgi:glycerate 2-kinase